MEVEDEQRFTRKWTREIDEVIKMVGDEIPPEVLKAMEGNGKNIVFYTMKIIIKVNGLKILLELL